jgi:folylpolyglutamate synthase/dihydrofolate synthase
MSSSQEIKFALSRINRVLKGKRTAGYRDIRLGLDRIKRVVPDKQEWKGIHVAGTNGKGSICTFLAGLFRLYGFGYGSFMSPAFPQRHHGVIINGLYVNPRMYEMEMQHVEEKWQRIATGWTYQHGDDPKGLSPFEAETATAFRVFNKMHVPYGIVEVGMGGATDATNAMKRKAVTIISKIGLDHQEYLGNTIENIAKVKAGIMRKNVPCIVDHTNSPAVIHVLRQHAREIGTNIILTWKGEPLLMTLNNKRWKLESYQVQNLLCAAMAFRHLFPQVPIDLNNLLKTDPFLPGRLETVRVDAPSVDTPRDILVDGAHNMLGIEALAKYVDHRLREPGVPVTWVMGMSASKDKPLLEIINKLVQPHDNFAMVEFTQGPNDPQPAPAHYGTDHARSLLQNPDDQVYDGPPDISAALPWACAKSEGGPVVVTGSLYLIRQLFELKDVHRSREPGTRRPGRSQLYRYSNLAREGKLTEHEKREFKEARRHFELSPRQSPIFRRTHSRKRTLRTVVLRLVWKKETRQLQSKAAFHKSQRRGYLQTIKALKKDRQVAEETGEGLESPADTLLIRVEDLEKQAEKHKAEYNEAMLKLRGYQAVPHMKYVTHREVFGYSKKPKAPTKSPFAAEKGPDKPRRKPGMAWKDRSQTFDEELAAAEKQRELAMKEAASKEAAKKSSDILVSKMAAGRRGMGGPKNS